MYNKKKQQDGLAAFIKNTYICSYYLKAACAAASRAIGTLNGEQLT